MTSIFSVIEEFLSRLHQDLSLFFSDPITFFDTYFFSAPGYNIYNTIVYTSLGLIAILLIGYIIKASNKKGIELWWAEQFVPIKMDSEFFVVILPYIFIGSTLRVL